MTSSSSSSSSSAVFLAPVDDYLGPSQACVNPLFSGSTKEPKESKSVRETAGVVHARQRRRRGGGTASQKQTRSTQSTSLSSSTTTTTDDIVKASLQDCLACSGCVTSAETVLLEEQHSHAILQDFITQHKQENSSSVLVMTISPASWADWMRHLNISTTSLQHFQRHMATLLHQTFQVTAVMDANVTLEWSLELALQEFCHAYQQKQQQHKQDMSKQELKKNTNDDQQEDQNNEDDAVVAARLDRALTPSTALNAQQTQYLLPDGTTRTVETTLSSSCTSPPQQQLPMLSGSCPAVVCLVEKSTHPAVPHVAQTKSPLSLAGAFWKRNHSNRRIFHVGIMPCHDKKLEASRKDFWDATHQNQPDVDLVLTTAECMEWILQQHHHHHHHQEHKQQDNDDEMEVEEQGEKTDEPTNNIQKEASIAKLREYLLSLPLAETTTLEAIHNSGQEDWLETTLASRHRGGRPLLITTPSSTTTTNATANNASSVVYPWSSGGFAHVLFCRAARRLFGVHIQDSPWTPVTSTTTTTATTAPQRPRSARVAAAQRRSGGGVMMRQRDFYQAILYEIQHQDGTLEYTTMAPSSAQQPICRPVLKFAIAHGMQTIQRVLQPFQANAAANTTGNNNSKSIHAEYDYIEAMACPSGCVNGGGQLRLKDRETPTETKQRVQATRAALAVPNSSSSCSNNSKIITQNGSDDERTTTPLTTLPPLSPRDWKTRYHVIPALQHTMGAAAGVAVKDTEW